MYYAFAVVAAIVALVLLTLYVLREQTGFLSRHERVDAELHSELTPTLAYEVPVGQDPAVILAALDRAGYTATSDGTHPRQTVLVACPGGIEGERPRVRAVIEAASVSAPPAAGAPLPVDVRFRDE